MPITWRALGDDLQRHGRPAPAPVAPIGPELAGRTLRFAQEPQRDQVGRQRGDGRCADAERPRHVGPRGAALSADVLEDLLARGPLSPGRPLAPSARTRRRVRCDVGPLGIVHRLAPEGISAAAKVALLILPHFGVRS
jgi:hypothetical protein